MHVVSARACVSPLIQDKIVPVYTILGLSLERLSSAEDVVLLGAVPRIFPNSLSGLAKLGRRAHFAAERNSSGDEDDDDLRAR